MRRLVRYVVAMGAAVFLLLGSADVFAQDGGVINLEESVIEGRIQKPEAFYILQHAKLKYEDLEPKKSFMPELLESVEKEPF